MRIETGVASATPLGAEAQQQKKLVDAAQQFEGMMLQEMLKPMRSGQDSWGGAAKDDDADAGSDTMTSFGTEAVANAIAKSGGLGIAKQVIRKVTLEHAMHDQKKTAGY